MNQTQVKYARDRASAILRSRKEAIKKKHTKPAIRLTIEEKHTALAAGAFTIDAKSRSYSWYDAVRFKSELDEQIDARAIEAETAALTEAYRALEDELVLGDNEMALRLLREFETASS